jgi:hypothetical protein
MTEFEGVTCKVFSLQFSTRSMPKDAAAQCRLRQVIVIEITGQKKEGRSACRRRSETDQGKERWVRRTPVPNSIYDGYAELAGKADVDIESDCLILIRFSSRREMEVTGMSERSRS